MTAAPPSSSPAAPDTSQHKELVQRPGAIAPHSTPRSAPAAAARPSSKTSSPPSEDNEDQDSSHSTVSRALSHQPAQQTGAHTGSHTGSHTGTLLAQTESMGEVHTLARPLSNTSDDSMSSRRPSTPRSQTDPAPENTYTYHTQPRNRSHVRSQSGHSALAPPMTRAHSLPIVMQTTGRLTLSPLPMPLDRPSSPLRSPKPRSPRTFEPRLATSGMQERYGSGIRPASVGSFEGAPSICDIAEDAELELTPRASSSMTSLYSSTSSLSRRRRPASPLYHVSIPIGLPPTSTPSASTPTSTASSPMLVPSKFNEHYPSSFASSSVPSTPTSMRSRSPSISSLETIPDSPDAEDQAIEADRIAQLKAAADREDGGESRRSSLDVEGRGRGFGFGKRDSRKRWSVCGGERRVDLSLGTVWED
ncbi:uncharacterized protein EKO05_0007725 [Ascochyta rabiei]|uniref:Uncharacterized protein n=1 Tax=Didymella rabiei TaxID=5454 RepID=A0A163CD46_DIDRA|nr:uncharacterized protein EKO05_0007725 [Ascochyta rabiei]KZM22377.1 hypothetical protein ST47_g6482 [Ascochyta rabiei]UPX17363.1 hypothetical protein EKO05_0007725 [Ascochyta rabiei]